MKALALRKDICQIGRSLFESDYVHADAQLHVLRTTFGAYW